MALPGEIDRSLKRANRCAYRKILKAMHELKGEGSHSIPWSVLSERTGIPREDRIDRAALELKAAGFFDQRTQQIGSLMLTDEEFELGWKRSYRRLRQMLFAQSGIGRMLARILPSGKSLSDSLAYDLIKWLLTGGAVTLFSYLAWECFLRSRVSIYW